MSDLVPFDPARAMDAVRERIQAEFVALIPPAAWSAMVKSAVDAFMEKELPKLVGELLKPKVTEAMQRYFQSNDWADQWKPDYAGGHPGLPKKLDQLVEANVEVFAKAAFEGALSSVFGAFRESLQRQLRVY